MEKYRQWFGCQKTYSVLLVIIVLIALNTAAAVATEASDTISVYVSILPQKFFVERIGGQRVRVGVMVGPGQNPHMYDPTPRQMTELSEAQLYFRIGVAFENVWMDRLAAINPGMRIVDTREGIALRQIEAHLHDEGGEHAHEQEGYREHQHEDGYEDHEMDPHIWMNPKLVIIQAETIAQALSEVDPDHADVYAENLMAFKKELDQLDQEIRQLLLDLPIRTFMVFHPSWGYFADEYGLTQIPIELQGKEPSAKELSEFAQLAKKENIRVIFVQSQFSVKSAQAVARAVGAEVVYLDPLAEDYLNNLRRTAQTLRIHLLR